jgi:hypothetical protein
VSGELVGEVLTARAGCLADLPATHTLALIAIANRCRTDSRQGWVVKSEITTAVGCSTRTAERIIAALTKRGLIEIVTRGYKLPGQQPRAPVYELSTLPPSKVAEAQAPLPPSKVAEAQGPRSRQIGTTLPPNPATLPPNRHHAPATQGGDLDVLTDVTNQTSLRDRTRARDTRSSDRSDALATRNGNPNPTARSHRRPILKGELSRRRHP